MITSTGQIDTYIPTRENLKIDFDDNKTGNYNLLVDDFQNNGTGTVYIDSVISTPNPQQYSTSWTGVVDNANDAVNYEIDTDNDGTYDESINLPPVFQDLIAPTSTYTISGELKINTTNSYIETATINLSSLDNEGGIGLDNIYYAIGTDSGSLVYVEYIEPIIVNGVGNYKDRFGNIEEVKKTTFSLAERPETYAGNISGYIYDDNNNNGLKDYGEKLMAGWKICIDTNLDGECQESTEPFNLTNNDGYYEFNSLATGQYRILEIPHQNWVVTNPTNKYYNINLLNGQVVTNKNFGNFKVKQNGK